MTVPQEPLARLENVSVVYRLFKQRAFSLKEYAIRWLRGGLEVEDFCALQSVTLDVAPGEWVSLVGRNGAGKSTLLRVFGRILQPSSGTAQLRGRVIPILQGGLPFDLDLSGLENVGIMGMMLGRSQNEIDQRLTDIVEFSELEDFIRAPVKTYSSGMKARLSFAIGTTFDADMILLDEVLTVGDGGFAERCKARLEELAQKDIALVVVSHSPDRLSSRFQRAVWLDGGRIRMDGDYEEVLAGYYQSLVRQEPEVAGGELTGAP